MKIVNIALPGLSYRQVSNVAKGRLLFASYERVAQLWAVRIGRLSLFGIGWRMRFTVAS